jgi:hypothetical protein
MARHDNDCLHCKINTVVVQHIEKMDTINVPDLAADMAECLAELILFAAPETDQPKLMDYTLEHFGRVFREKHGLVPGEDLRQ